MMNRKDVLALREKYPAGTRIRLTKTMDDPQPVEAGSCGTVTGVDDAGQIMMKWDAGRSLSLLPEIDEFEIIED